MDPHFNLDHYIKEHLLNSNQWHLPFLPPLAIPKFLTLHGLFLIIAAIVLILLFVVLYDKKARVPRGITNLLEALVVFIRDEIAINFLGEEDGRRFTPLLCTFFFFILFLNLMGLVPIFPTVTANINVTAALALITFGVMTIGAILRNGIGGFFKAFAPAGVPWPILLFLVPLEFLGLFVKTFALMVRLFANMLAGHIMIFSILSFVVIFGWIAFPSVFFGIGIGLLEVMIAFLQAYIFTLLSAIFIGQLYHPQH